jgi:glyoxylase-like metal-dependent hydrolase (beta-lactamase superfamily II)
MIERLTVGPIGECCYFLPVRDPASCIVVDPGDEAPRILAYLAERGLKPLALALTHGHLDHTAALPALIADFSAQGIEVPVAIHSGDRSYLGKGAADSNRAVFSAMRSLGFFKHYIAEMPEASIVLADGDLLPGSDWKVIHTPGHTRGSVCFYHEGAGILISGDTLFRDGVGRTDGPDSDGAALQESIATRLFVLPDSTIVYPGHGDPTSIGREKSGVASAY